MRDRNRHLAVALALALGAGRASADDTTEKGPAMTLSAHGTFDVKVAPLEQQPYPDGQSLGRYALDKQYHGELEATAHGEMLTAATPTEGSAAYVAVERVEGALAGRRGSFLLQHAGKMAHGEQWLTITVVPDSGTGELVGLEGRLDIQIVQGRHDYQLAYSLPDTP